MHPLVDSSTCPDLGSNTQPWRIGMTPYPTELQARVDSFLSALFSQPRTAFLIGSSWLFVLRGQGGVNEWPT